jgi:hypothetical protein
VPDPEPADDVPEDDVPEDDVLEDDVFEDEVLDDELEELAAESPELELLDAAASSLVLAPESDPEVLPERESFR